jgi:hypothetical protein
MLKEIGAKEVHLTYFDYNLVHFKVLGGKQLANIEELIKKAIEVEDEAEREQVCIYICRLMKVLVLTNSKEMLEDSVALENLRRLSGGKLNLDSAKVASENLLSLNPKEITQAIPSNQQRSGKNRNQRNFQHKRRR